MSDLLSLVNLKPKSNLERNISIYREYKTAKSQGKYSLKKLGLKHGLTKQRILQIVDSVELKILKGEIK